MCKFNRYFLFIAVCGLLQLGWSETASAANPYVTDVHFDAFGTQHVIYPTAKVPGAAFVTPGTFETWRFFVVGRGWVQVNRWIGGDGRIHGTVFLPNWEEPGFGIIPMRREDR